MTIASHLSHLYLHGARTCHLALDWSESYGLDWERAWAECQRGDWMLWLCEAIGVDYRWIRMAAVWCAVPSLRYVPSGERRPHDALWTACLHARGEATDEELATARAAALTAAANDAVWSAADDAACAAAEAAAWNAVWSAVWSAAEAAASDVAETASLAASADSVRTVIPWRMVEGALRAKGMMA